MLSKRFTALALAGALLWSFVPAARGQNANSPPVTRPGITAAVNQGTASGMVVPARQLIAAQDAKDIATATNTTIIHYGGGSGTQQVAESLVDFLGKNHRPAAAMPGNLAPGKLMVYRAGGRVFSIMGEDGKPVMVFDVQDSIKLSGELLEALPEVRAGLVPSGKSAPQATGPAGMEPR